MSNLAKKRAGKQFVLKKSRCPDKLIKNSIRSLNFHSRGQLTAYEGSAPVMLQSSLYNQHFFPRKKEGL